MQFSMQNMACLASLCCKYEDQNTAKNKSLKKKNPVRWQFKKGLRDAFGTSFPVSSMSFHVPARALYCTDLNYKVHCSTAW